MKLINTIRKLNIPTKISILVGVITIIAGIYYLKNNLISTGVTMSEIGESNKLGVIDGKGMIFCGIIIIVLGSLIFNSKYHNNNMNQDNSE